MGNLVVPGVSVEARFDVLPPLPAPSGIVGAVGIVDRPGTSLVSVTKASELRQLLGPGTAVTMPEVVHALANGAAQAVIAPVTGTSAAPATVDLLNKNSQVAVRLRCRCPGTWANKLLAEVRATTDSTGEPLRVTVRLILGSDVVETFADQRIAPGGPDDLFDTINTSSQYVVAVDPSLDKVTLKKATLAFGDTDDALQVKDAADKLAFLLAPARGVDKVGMSVTIDLDDKGRISLSVSRNGPQEQFTGLTLDPDDDNYLPYVLLQQSRLLRFRPKAASDHPLPISTAAPRPFSGGVSPTVEDYQRAIELLADDPTIDLVLASIEPGRSDDDVHDIHQALLAHAVTSADKGAPRIAFGSITANEAADVSLQTIREHSALVRHRRFVLVAPPQAEGAVTGVVGRLPSQESPTFKTVPLFGVKPAKFRDSQLDRLLGSAINLLVIQERVGRGVVTLRGIDTTGDQISVTRVADEAIRETKAIAENFIGRLNDENARTALKQQIKATFTRMERDGALVPSTDGKDPAFVVDVYSTQLDFAQGIVRIDIAVRPVRAIDYIYATIHVRN